MTFPASESQLPRPKVDGFDELDPDFGGAQPSPDARLTADYDIEGSDVGYRWNARKGHKALFPFGYGLSYTTFATSGLKTNGVTASFEVRNTGKRAGATVAQLYLVSRGGEKKQRLVGYRRVQLDAGESRQLTLSIDPRLLADWRDGAWRIPAGEYRFALGEHAEALGPETATQIKARHWQR
jgi:beta-glucosidase